LVRAVSARWKGYIAWILLGKSCIGKVERYIAWILLGKSCIGKVKGYIA